MFLFLTLRDQPDRQRRHHRQRPLRTPVSLIFCFCFDVVLIKYLTFSFFFFWTNAATKVPTDGPSSSPSKAPTGPPVTVSTVEMYICSKNDPMEEICTTGQVGSCVDVSCHGRKTCWPHNCTAGEPTPPFVSSNWDCKLPLFPLEHCSFHFLHYWSAHTIFNILFHSFVQPT